MKKKMISNLNTQDYATRFDKSLMVNNSTGLLVKEQFIIKRHMAATVYNAIAIKANLSANTKYIFEVIINNETEQLNHITMSFITTGTAEPWLTSFKYSITNNNQVPTITNDGGTTIIRIPKTGASKSPFIIAKLFSGSDNNLRDITIADIDI